MKNLKHLFLLLFLSVATLQAQTRSEIQTQIETIATGVPNTALKIRTVLAVLADGTAQTGDIKEIDVSTAYIAANFDPSGLGTNERLGWAICNGNNGTRNRSGRVSIAYDVSNYPTLGAVGGEKDHVLTVSEIPAHRHLNGVSNDNTNPYVYGGVTTDMPGTAVAEVRDEGGARTYQGNTSYAGSGSAHNNMQPYMVTLVIMKL